MIESLLNSLFHLFSNLYFYLYFFMLFPNLSLWLINMKEHELIWITMNKYEVTWRNMYYNEMNNKDLKRFPSEVWRPKLITISDSNKDWKWIWMKWIWEWILDGLVFGRQPYVKVSISSSIMVAEISQQNQKSICVTGM